MFWLKLLKWILIKVEAKDLIKNTDIDNQILLKLIEIVNNEIEKRQKK